MIGPYSEMLHGLQDKISSLEFGAIQDSDYQTVFEKSEWWLIFRTDRYYQPSIDLWIADHSPDGDKQEFAVWLLIEILAPKFMHRARAGDLSYAALFDMVSQQVDFLSKYRDRLFAVPPPYLDEYKARNEGLASDGSQ